jgi:hypothetical protein
MPRPRQDSWRDCGINGQHNNKNKEGRMISGLFDITVVGGIISQQQDITTQRQLSSSEPHNFYQGTRYTLANHAIFDAGIAQNTQDKNIIAVIYKPKFFMLSAYLLTHKKAKNLHQAILCVNADHKMQVKNHTVYRGWKSGLLRDGGLFLLCIVAACLGFFSLAYITYSAPLNASLTCTSIFLALLGLEFFAKFMLYASAPKYLKRYFVDQGLYRGKNIVIDMPLQIQSTNYDNPHHVGRIHLFKANEALQTTKKNFILSER